MIIVTTEAARSRCRRLRSLRRRARAPSGHRGRGLKHERDEFGQRGRRRRPGVQGGAAAAGRVQRASGGQRASAGSTPAQAQQKDPSSSGFGSDVHKIVDWGPGWATIAGTAHAAYTAPDEIVNSLKEAAGKNQSVADAITSLARTGRRCRRPSMPPRRAI